MNVIQKLHNEIEEADLWNYDMLLKRNDYIKTSGTIDTNLYYVSSGSLRIYFINEFEEHLVRFGYKDNFITALDSFITEAPSELYIQANKLN